MCSSSSNHENNPDTVESRRWIVRDDNPASPSDRRSTLPSPRGRRCCWMKPRTSATATSTSTSTSTGSLPTTAKNAGRSVAPQIPVQDRMPQLRHLEGTLMSRQNTTIQSHENQFLSGTTTRPNDEPTQA